MEEHVSLSFQAVDGIGFAAERGRLSAVPASYKLTATRLGPLFEALHLHGSGLAPAHPHWLETGRFTDLWGAVVERRAAWWSRGSICMGMMQIAPLSQSNQWVAFAMEAKRAATNANFDSGWAGQMIAAMRELEDNVREHAGSLEGAYVAYHATDGLFEFVVADHGRGVLSTLREAAEQRALSNDSDALKAALTEGVSRFGSGTRRGYGYRPLFTGLVNRRAGLRFRSGSGALYMDGVSPGLPSAQIGVKPRLSGLFVSVSCNLS